MHLDAKLNFEKHLDNIMNTVAKTIGLLRKLQAGLPCPSLVTIYKAFIRPHLDYGDIIYDRAYNESFHQKLESIQYNAALAITGAIRGTLSRTRLRISPRTTFGIENYVTFLKYLKVNLRIIFSKYSLVLKEHITQEMLITFPVSIPDTIFSGILFSHQL